MSRRELAALILSSALITFDGVGVTLALPAIGHDLGASVARLHWIANAPLLALAAMLLPAGRIGDRVGHLRLLRAGLTIFAASSAMCAAAWSDLTIIVARLGQGAGGALVLPAVLATMRSAFDEPLERMRIFGKWAAWTGVANAVGPLVAGTLVDRLSWRAVFAASIALGVAAMVLLPRGARSRSTLRCDPISGIATGSFVLLIGALCYGVMLAARDGISDAALLYPVVIAVAAGLLFARDPSRHVLLPRQLLHARNSVAANATDFALYFGMFGLSFVLAMYVQQVLRYSASWAAVSLLPISLMLLLAERFSGLTSRLGTKALVIAGALIAASGIAWIATAPDPIPFWSNIIAGTTVFGLGMSLTISGLTNAAIAAVPASCSGAAAGLNHAVVRGTGLIAVATVGSIASPGGSELISAEGFRQAVLVCAAIVAAGSFAGAQLRDGEAGGVIAETGVS
ncbi:MAG TPA: MFS transporter [Vicinamibacterales bacterium]|nr:MFS transporter [Vicinamibacterales bacterium]